LYLLVIKKPGGTETQGKAEYADSRTYKSLFVDPNYYMTLIGRVINIPHTGIL